MTVFRESVLVFQLIQAFRDILFPFYYLILQVCQIHGFRLGLTLFFFGKVMT